MATAHAAMMITIPAMPRFMDEIDRPSYVGAYFSFGIALSLSSFGRFLTNIPAGVLSEKIGRKHIIVVGAVIVAIFSTLSGTAPNAPVFWIYRFFIGVGSAMVITIANVVATDLSSVENRGRVLGLMHGMQLIVGISTPALGGFLAEYVSLRTPFYVSGVGIGVFAIWGLFRLPETRPQIVVAAGPAGAESRRSLGTLSLLKDPSFFLICMVGFSTFFLRGGATTGLIPIFMNDVLDAGPGALGLLFTASSIIHGIIVYPSGAAADRWGRKPLIVPAGFAVGIGVAAIPFMTEMVPFVVTFLVLHAAVGWGGQAPTAYMGDIAPPGMRGPSFGMYRTFGDAAGIMGPLIATGLAQVASFEIAFGLGAVLWTATILAFARYAKESAGPNRTHPRTIEEPADRVG
jgi:DHA1 family multidrug resistance protein-like MFS transporter